MTPYFDDGLTTIYHGDCREILPLLEPGSVDLVLTDPPYGVEYVTNRRSAGDPLAAGIANDDSLNVLFDSLPGLERVLRDDRHAYVFASPTRIGGTVDILSAYWQIKNILVWDKGDAGTVGDLVAGYAMNWEAIVYASKGRRPLNGKRPRAIYRYDWSASRDPVHPTVKPVGLLTWLIDKSTDAGEVVIDPFAGSGTTLRAARNLGRKAIGIEVDERYCEVAVQRLAQQALPLFGD